MPVSYRLTRIYTRTGDDGTTAFADGTRVPKDHRRVEALGCLDELNSLLGVVAAYTEAKASEELALIQHRLFDLGAELAVPGSQHHLGADAVAWVEQHLDAYNARLPPLREFVLPGGGEAAAHCHLARAVCRRCERRLVSLAREGDVNPRAVHYVNRLSDFLFVLARVLSRRGGGKEVVWEPTSTQ